jgi:hypothetical protein
MPFLAIIVDFIAVGLYHIQAINLTSSILLIGLIGQALITLVFLFSPSSTRVLDLPDIN